MLPLLLVMGPMGRLLTPCVAMGPTDSWSHRVSGGPIGCPQALCIPGCPTGHPAPHRHPLVPLAHPSAPHPLGSRALGGDPSPYWGAGWVAAGRGDPMGAIGRCQKSRGTKTRLESNQPPRVPWARPPCPIAPHISRGGERKAIAACSWAGWGGNGPSSSFPSSSSCQASRSPPP